MYTRGLFISVYGKNHHNIVIIYQLNNLKNQKINNSKVYKQQTNVEAPSPSSSVLPRPTVCSWEEWLGFLRLYTFCMGVLTWLCV